MKIVAALFAALFASLASATTVTTDFTDNWWVPGESGWGANVVQQGDTLFVTVFVYGLDGTATWYVAPSTAYQGLVGGSQQFSGPLYRTTGPYFGGTFDASGVAATPVGTLRFFTPQTADAELVYDVNGVTVTKSVTRQTWRVDNISGAYAGATVGGFDGACFNRGGFVSPATYIARQVGTQVTIDETGPHYACRYTGTLSQTGRLGTIMGTAQCSDTGTGTFTASEVQAGLDFLSMRLNSQAGTCSFVGRMGGMRTR